MKGIYIITNILDGKYYVGSSKDVKERLKHHKYHLKTNKHRNSKLQNAYNAHGLNNFSFDIIEKVDDSLTKDELLAVEQTYLDVAAKIKTEVYNLSFIANSGGAEVMRIPCFLLDLYGNIINKFESISDCYKNYLKMSNCSSSVNSGIMHFKKYRVVTCDFYENNKDIIFSWKTISKVPPKPIKEVPKIYCDFENEILEFYSNKEVGEKIGVSAERARQLKYGLTSKYYIRYEKDDILEKQICITINNKNFKFNSLSEIGADTGISIFEIRQILRGNKNNPYNIRFITDEDEIDAQEIYLKDDDILSISKNIFSSCG